MAIYLQYRTVQKTQRNLVLYRRLNQKLRNQHGNCTFCVKSRFFSD